MEFTITNVKKAPRDIAELYEKKYNINYTTEKETDTLVSGAETENMEKGNLNPSYKEELIAILKNHFSRLRDDIQLLIETDYVDKMYRDLYYHYFSTKMDNYPRNCIRVSLFDRSITPGIFFDKKLTRQVRENQEYLGFYVIRPTFPHIIGRNVISPKALKREENNFRTCTTCFSTTAYGVKFDVIGFPHTSQDGEMLSCADVTIWTMLEYFGNKYPEYCVTPPSHIISSLKNLTFERQLPTRGLPVQNISYALKEHGLGPRIFARENYEDFDQLLSCYTESGIPVVVCIEEKTEDETETKFAHATICTGHVNENTDECIEHANEFFRQDSHPIKIYDWHSFRKEFIFADDNCPVYTKSYLDDPVSYYEDFNIPPVENAEITHFIAPLYTKIYLDAHEAKRQIEKYIHKRSMFFLKEDWDHQIILRTFLCSGRSYKQYIVHNTKIDKALQDLILRLEMPKFIWIGELSTPEFVRKKEINGLILLDATEPRFERNKSLLLITNSTVVAYRENTGNLLEVIIEEGKNKSKDENDLKKNSLPLPSFSRFESNIKSFE